MVTQTVKSPRRQTHQRKPDALPKKERPWNEVGTIPWTSWYPGRHSTVTHQSVIHRALVPAGANLGLVSWLPEDFEHPTKVSVGRAGHHLRPIDPADTELDMIAVMGSQQRLWSIYGEAWGWPSATMTAEADREDLARHAQEIEDHESFNYALFNSDETALLGCVYIDPPEKQGADAEISWWVVDALVGSELEATLDHFVPRWVENAWPLEHPRYVGSDLSWREWIDLPDLPRA